MLKPLDIEILDQRLELHPERVVYWHNRQSLILSDLHLGKVSHFRRHGFNLPEAPSHHNFLRLERLMAHYEPEDVYFLGDLFHSAHNREFDTFRDFLDRFPQIHFHLIRGNHDILPRRLYQSTRLQVHEEPFAIDPFYFHHHPLETEENGFHFAGHIHPGVMLAGGGRQRLKLPCFYQQHHQMILPAFGEFTGKAQITPRNGDRIYVIAEQEVFAFS